VTVIILCSNVTLRVFCVLPDLGLDMQDNTGRHEVGAVENVTRLPVNNGEGCHFKAHFKINKVCILSLPRTQHILM